MALLLKNILTSIPMAQVMPKTEYFAYEKMYCSPDPSTNSESTNPVFFLTNYTQQVDFFKRKSNSKETNKICKNSCEDS